MHATTLTPSPSYRTGGHNMSPKIDREQTVKWFGSEISTSTIHCGMPQKTLTFSRQQISTVQTYSSHCSKTTTWKWHCQRAYQRSKCSTPETIPVPITSSAVLTSFRPSQSVTRTPTSNLHEQTISQYEESSTSPQKEPPRPLTSTGGQSTGTNTEQN